MINQLSVEEIEEFLISVEKDFPIPLSQKGDLHHLACKFYNKATICSLVEVDKVKGMVIGYTENLVENLAYISIVAVDRKYRGKGYAKKLVLEFIDECKNKNIKAVHLYTDTRNTVAIRLYKQMGFIDYKVRDELRPQDKHYILYFNQES